MEKRLHSLTKLWGDYVVDGDNMISDWDKYINNLEYLYKFHAFSVQDFEPRKEQIFNKLIANIHLYRLIKALKEKKYLEMIYELSQSLLKSPTLLPKKLISKITIALSSVSH